MKLNGKFKTGLRPSCNLSASYIKCNIYALLSNGYSIDASKGILVVRYKPFHTHYYKTRIFRLTLFSRAYIFGLTRLL